mmetsp:Transcript_19084/g.62227  ORF Transcript_19084/g.62227 Transcript_19084/m.62227 type:complete len:335 (+) Transcript_19084:195-1199(+)
MGGLRRGVVRNATAAVAWMLAAALVLATIPRTTADVYSYDYSSDDDWYFSDSGSNYWDDYYMDYFNFLFDEDCVLGDDGEYFYNGTSPCDLKVTGGMEATKLGSDGMEGLYVYVGCQNGKPMYKRVEAGADEPGFTPRATPLEPRYVIYSSYWGDWDVTKDAVLSDESTLAYGGEGEGESFPQFVPRNDWYVLAELSDEDVDEDFVYAPSLNIECNFNCTDGIQNGYEMGIDCGGDCAPCAGFSSDYADDAAAPGGGAALDQETLHDLEQQQQARIALRMKVKNEGTTELSVFEKIMIVLVCFVGTLIVAGGPLMYWLRNHYDPKSRRRGAGRT